MIWDSGPRKLAQNFDTPDDRKKLADEIIKHFSRIQRSYTVSNRSCH
jgi:hypothetical protein